MLPRSVGAGVAGAVWLTKSLIGEECRVESGTVDQMELLKDRLGDQGFRDFPSMVYSHRKVKGYRIRHNLENSTAGLGKQWGRKYTSSIFQFISDKSCSLTFLKGTQKRKNFTGMNF